MEKFNEKNMVNDNELDQVAGGGHIKELWETAEEVIEVATTIMEAFNGTNNGNDENTNVTAHGSGASGSW